MTRYQLHCRDYTTGCYSAHLGKDTLKALNDVITQSPDIIETINSLESYIGVELTQPKTGEKLFELVVAHAIRRVSCKTYNERELFKAFTYAVTERLSPVLNINVQATKSSVYHKTWEPLHETIEDFSKRFSGTPISISEINTKKKLRYKSKMLISTMLLSNLVNKPLLEFFQIKQQLNGKTLKTHQKITKSGNTEAIQPRLSGIALRATTASSIKAPAIEESLRLLFCYIGGDLIHPNSKQRLFDHIALAAASQALLCHHNDNRNNFFKAHIRAIIREMMLLLSLNIKALKGKQESVWDITQGSINDFIAKHNNWTITVSVNENAKPLCREAKEFMQAFFLTKITNRAHLRAFGIPAQDESHVKSFKEVFSDDL